MSDAFGNVYDDRTRAEAYAGLDFPGTYFLAFRDIPAILQAHVRGTRALDFGCGTGRSSRFLRALGFEVTGIDIAEAMLAQARARDPGGDYRLVPDGDLGGLPAAAYDVVFAAFTFDNIPGFERKAALFAELGRVLAPGGRIVTIVSAPEIYVNEWASFSTRDFPGNRAARSGDRVRIVMLDVPDRRPVEDIVWTDESYREVYRAAGIEVERMERPLAAADDGREWVSERTVAPWTIYVLRPAPAGPD